MNRIRKMYVAVALLFIAANLTHPVTPSIIVNLNLPSYSFGLAFAAMSLAQFISSPMWVSLCHRYGIRKVSIVSLIGYIIGQLMFGLADGLIMIILGRFVAGLFAAGTVCGQLLYIANNTNEEQRGVSLGMAATVQAVLSPIGYLLGGLIGSKIPRYSFYVQAVVLALLAVYYLLFIEEDPVKTVLVKKSILNEINPFRNFIDARSVLNRGVLLFLAVVCLSSIGSTAFDQVYNYAIKSYYGLSSSYNGIIKAGVGFITLLTNMTIIRYFSHRNIRNKALIVLNVLTAIAVSVLMIKDSLRTFVIAVVVALIMQSMVAPLLQGLTSTYDDKEGHVIGLFNSVRHIGSFIGSIVAGFIYGVSMPACYGFVTVICLIAGGIGIVLIKYSHNRKFAE